MKIIKFRIWNPEEKKMYISGATPTMLHSFFQATAILHVNKNIEYQQFTGLLDKIGREIYEGDIVKDREYILSVIIDTTHGLRFVLEMNTLTQSYYEQITYGQSRKLEIIGNIYENKDLLE